MKTLEKILNSVKKVGRKALAPVLISMMLAGPVFAGKMRVYNRSDALDDTSMNMRYVEDSNDGYDGEDSTWENSSNELQIYSNIPDHQLKEDSRDPNSTTTFKLDLYKNGTSLGDNYLRFRMYDINDFEWKNVFLGGVDDSNDIVADIKYVISSDGRTYGDGTPYGDFDLPDVNSTDVEVYDKRKIKFFNHADLNRDRKVNGLDYTIFSKEWLENDSNRLGSNVGSDTNDLGAYADMDRSGTVDYNDASLFVNEWLWDADDPNTW